MSSKILLIGSDEIEFKDFKVNISNDGIKVFNLSDENGSVAKKACYSPSFRLFVINSELILNALYKDRSEKYAWEFNGAYLGGMELFSGYIRADMGPWEHPVKSLSINISVAKEALSFSMKGSFGDVLTWRDLGMHGNDEYSKKFEQFEIEFEANYDELGVIFQYGNAADRIKDYSLNYILDAAKKERLSRQP